MNSRVAGRIGRPAQVQGILSQLINKMGYMILVFVALWASARFSEWAEQFIALAIIFGWKWICGNQTQVIQIINIDEKEYQ